MVEKKRSHLSSFGYCCGASVRMRLAVRFASSVPVEGFKYGAAADGCDNRPFEGMGGAATSRRFVGAAPSWSAVVEALHSLHVGAICGGCCAPVGNDSYSKRVGRSLVATLSGQSCTPAPLLPNSLTSPALNRLTALSFAGGVFQFHRPHARLRAPVNPVWMFCIASAF